MGIDIFHSNILFINFNFNFSLKQFHPFRFFFCRILKNQNPKPSISCKFTLSFPFAFGNGQLTLNWKRFFWKIWFLNHHHFQSLNVIASVSWILERMRNWGESTLHNPFWEVTLEVFLAFFWYLIIKHFFILFEVFKKDLDMWC
jgi:hypothetical protein